MSALLLTTINHSVSNEIESDPLFHRNLVCLTHNIYFEARGESPKGQLAVAHVTMNRVESGRYPDDVCDVVYQKNQFSWTKTNIVIKSQELYNKAMKIAYNVLLGDTKDPTHGALYFHSINIEPNWNRTVTAQIGNHIFYR